MTLYFASGVMDWTMQCEAVTMWYSEINAPPQMCFQTPSDPFVSRDTCQGIGVFAGYPPTILPLRSLTPRTPPGSPVTFPYPHCPPCFDEGPPNLALPTRCLDEGKNVWLLLLLPFLVPFLNEIPLTTEAKNMIPNAIAKCMRDFPNSLLAILVGSFHEALGNFRWRLKFLQITVSNQRSN